MYLQIHEAARVTKVVTEGEGGGAGAMITAMENLLAELAKKDKTAADLVYDVLPHLKPAPEVSEEEV